MLGSKGLIVVDVHQAWCGPCKTVVNLFRKIRNELCNDLLRFAVAEADSIDSLEKYRGKCEPTFLFFAVTNILRDLFPVCRKDTSERTCQPLEAHCTSKGATGMWM
uniref:Thioredoxin domain-containing protein n=1 Tax=Salvator merianae TaxID=96440 RepID=A0A8D0EB20_SALMN